MACSVNLFGWPQTAQRPILSRGTYIGRDDVDIKSKILA